MLEGGLSESESSDEESSSFLLQLFDWEAGAVFLSLSSSPLSLLSLSSLSITLSELLESEELVSDPVEPCELVPESLASEELGFESLVVLKSLLSLPNGLATEHLFLGCFADVFVEIEVSCFVSQLSKIPINEGGFLALMSFPIPSLYPLNAQQSGKSTNPDPDHREENSGPDYREEKQTADL